MGDSIFCIFYKKIYLDGSNIRVDVTKTLSNLSEDIDELLTKKSINTFSNFYYDFFFNKKERFKSNLSLKLDDKDSLDFWVYSTIINKANNKVYLIEVYNENTQHLKDVFEYLDESELISFVVYYDDKVLFTDKGFEKLTGYTLDYIGDISFSSLFNEYFSETVKILSEKRKSGIRLSHFYHYLPFKVINGNIKYFHVQDVTINYQGVNAGCMFFIDVTSETSYRDIYSILYKVNKVVSTNFLSYESFFEQLCKEIVSDKNISFAWVGKVSGKKIRPLASEGYDEGYLNYFLSVLHKDGFWFGPTFKSIRDNIIKVNSDTKNNLSISLWQKEMLKRNFLSSCAIPFTLDDEKYVLNMYSNKEYFFSENTQEALEVLQEVVANHLNNIKELNLKNTFFSAIENTYDWIMITDKSGIIEYVNDAVVNISGYKKEELIGATPAIFKSGIYEKSFYKSLWETILTGNIFKGAVINKKKNDELFQIDNTIVPIMESGVVKKFVSIAKDVSKEIYLEEEIHKFKYRDILTGLLNREAFIKQIDKEIEFLRGSKSVPVVLIVDIYNFTKLNDIYGFYTCDHLLQKVSIMLENAFYKTDIISRVGSDSFGLFIKLHKESDIFNILNKILDLFGNEVDVGGKKVKVDTNIGVAFCNDGLAASYISRAEVALNLSKNKGANSFNIYNEEINKSISEHFEKTNLIKECIQYNYFAFHLQPIYEAETFNLKSFEALVRINHPKKGLIYPNYFIDFIENSDLLYRFEKILFKNIVEYAKAICMEFGRCIDIAVNISANSFANGYILDYINEIPEELKGVINLEITERVFLKNVENTLEIMNELKSKGYKIEIDDFGTGFSSLGFIDKVPADFLKIDMTFVRKMIESNKIKGIVKTIIELSNNLGIQTIAEGVETKEQADLLSELGCKYLQGYYFAKPMPLEDALELFKRQI
ncbi:MAG: signal transduction sensor histidine kinase/response regulator [Deferribacteraceae bacterium]|jgi:diguanylate cyclase (GGDEF)-like protein/PAS domain S-box-containing protein|nr:signal transduction sensor histidine kinase/response regulator [Deferribacteraceae bacterium]